jgi:hypothetical protein
MMHHTVAIALYQNLPTIVGCVRKHYTVFLLLKTIWNVIIWMCSLHDSYVNSFNLSYVRCTDITELLFLLSRCD